MPHAPAIATRRRLLGAALRARGAARPGLRAGRGRQRRRRRPQLPRARACSSRATRSRSAGRRSRSIRSTRPRWARWPCGAAERIELRPRGARGLRGRAHEAGLRHQPQQPDRRAWSGARRSSASSTACPEHVLPVLDEAYFEYVDDPEYPDGASEQLARGRRCVVLRTFSKIYGLAGFRVGYGLCPPDVAAACLKVKNAFDVTQSALDAALASLDAGEEVARRRDGDARGPRAAGRRPARAGIRPARGRRELPLRRRGGCRRIRCAARAPGRDRAPARRRSAIRPRCASASARRTS